jgi:hypothetical protein
MPTSATTARFFRHAHICRCAHLKRIYLGSVARMRTTDLHRRADEDIHVHLVAFIAHQYYRLHDNLVDVLLTSVQTFENATLREHRDWCFDERKRHEHATESLLADLDASVFQILRQIREAVSDDVLSDQEKVAQIGLLVLPEHSCEHPGRYPLQPHGHDGTVEKGSRAMMVSVDEWPSRCPPCWNDRGI